MKLEEVLNSELKIYGDFKATELELDWQGYSTDWQGYLAKAQTIMTEQEIEYMFRIGKELAQKAEQLQQKLPGAIFFTTVQDYFVYSLQIIGNKSADFKKWSELGKTFFSSDYFKNTARFLCGCCAEYNKDNINFEKIVEDGLYFHKISPAITRTFFNCFGYADVLKQYASWINAVKVFTDFGEDFLEKIISSSMLYAWNNPNRNLEIFFERTKELAEINIEAAKAYAINAHIAAHSSDNEDEEDEWYEFGKKITEQNINAGVSYFEDPRVLIRNGCGGRRFDQLKSLFEKCNKDQDYNFLRYWLVSHHKYNKDGKTVKLDEFQVFEFLLKQGKKKQFKLGEAKKQVIPFKSAKDMKDDLILNLYFGIRNNDNRIKSRFKDVISKIREYNFQGKSLRKELSKIFQEATSEDKNSIQISHAILEDKINSLKIEDREIKKFLELFSDFDEYVMKNRERYNLPLTQAKLQINNHFADDLLNNWTLDSCVFGPAGEERDACLIYACDPNIELVFLSVYSDKDLIDNFAVGYIINTKENIWVLDGVDAGIFVEGLSFDWKEFYYDNVIDMAKNSPNPPKSLVANINIGKKNRPNEFLRYICERKGINYNKIKNRKKDSQKKSAILHKPLLSESNPEAYKAIGTNLSYLDAWYKSNGNKAWNTGQGEVEYIELF